MRVRNIAIFSAAVLAGALGGSLVGPRPAEAVARELIELQRDVTSLLQGQKDLSTQMTQDHTVMKTLVEQSGDTVGKLNGTMSALQKSMQDVQANSGARLDTMSTQVQGLSDNLEEIKSRLGKLNQQLVDLQNTVQSLDAKVSGGGGTAPSSGVSNPGAGLSSQPPAGGTMAPAGAASGPAPSADTLYSNGLRDITSGKYDLARQEFQDYLKYYGETDLAPNAQFYLGEIAYKQKQYDQAVAEYDKVLTSYPRSFKIQPAHLRKGMALIELGQKTQGVRELRDVIKHNPGSEEDRIARAKLKELGVPITATTASH
jgi:tol-pal system protein YbgF